MGLREYEYFLAIAEEMNITKAAQRLNLSQPSLTQQLQRTEQEFNCKLLLRTNSGVRLTEAGEAYLQMAKQMLQLYENFKYEIGELRKLHYGKLRIGASWYLTTTLLSVIIKEYTRQFPDILLDCIESRTSLLLEQLHSGQIDIAFVSLFPHENSTNQKRLTYLPLYRDPFCMVAPAGCPLQTEKGQSWVDLTSLDNCPFIMFRPNQRIRQITDHIFSQAGIHPRIRLTTYGFHIAMTQIASGMGVAILPSGYINVVKENYNINVYELNPAYNAYWDIGTYYPHYDIMPFALKAFVECIKDFVGKKVLDFQGFLE